MVEIVDSESVTGIITGCWVCAYGNMRLRSCLLRKTLPPFPGDGCNKWRSPVRKPVMLRVGVYEELKDRLVEFQGFLSDPELQFTPEQRRVLEDWGLRLLSLVCGGM